MAIGLQELWGNQEYRQGPTSRNCFRQQNVGALGARGARQWWTPFENRCSGRPHVPQCCGTLATAPSAHLLADEHARLIAGALAAGPTLVTVFPAGNCLADQLKLVARMVSTATAVRARRQVFLCHWAGSIPMPTRPRVHPALLKIADDRILDQSGLFEN